MKRDTLAIVGPWPPEHTGIADYAYELVSELRKIFGQVTIYTRCERPRPLADVEVVTVEEGWDGSALASRDHILYQMGNNTTFHNWMVPLIKEHAGIIQLHDMVLHHIEAWNTWLKGDLKGYLDLLGKWYGPEARAFAKQETAARRFIWESGHVTRYPLFEETIQHAKGVIVHSRFAFERVKQAFPDMACLLARQNYAPFAPDPGARELHRIGIFGGIDKQKRLEWVLDALEAPALRRHRLRVDIVGAISKACLDLEERCKTIADHEIVFHGRVDDAEFQALMEATDLCVSFRYPTMGETSAIIMRAVCSGIPCVVSDIGWYAELPDEIVKLDVKQSADRLAELLTELCEDSSAYRRWRNQTARLAAAEEFSTEHAASSIADFTRTAVARTWFQGMVAREMAAMGIRSKGKTIEEIGDSIASAL